MSEKRYYWLKLKNNFFNTNDIKIIRKQDNGAEYTIFWQQLLLLAISSKEIGIIRYKDNIPYTPDLLSIITDTNVDIIKGALSLFEKLKMIEINEKGDIVIDYIIQEMIGSETSVAKLVREHRKRKALLCNNLKQNCNIEKEIETELNIETEKKIDNKAKTEFEKTLDEFYKMRKTIKKPMTGLAKKMLFEKLNKLAGNDEKLKIEILKESIFKNWQGVFPLKDDFDKSKISAMEQNYLDWKIAEEQNGNK